MSIIFPTYATSATIYDITATQITLQLHGEGVVSANNSTIVDASTNTFVLTRYGTVTQGSVNPFGSNWSFYLSTSRSYSTYGIISPLQNWQRYFSVEAWIYMTAFPVQSTENPYISSVVGDMLPTVGGSTTYWTFGPNSSGQLCWYWINYAAFPTRYYAVSTGTSMSLNTWYHIAMTVDQSTLFMFVNGVQQTLWGTLAPSSVFTYDRSDNYYYTGASAFTSGLTIGSQGGTTGSSFIGYISNVRIVNGTSTYINTFTPSPYPLTTVTNTQFLVAASNNFQDISTSSLVSTATVGIQVTRFSPVSTTTAYVTSVATVQGSTYFDGSTGYLSSAGQIANFGTGNFTIDCWFNVSNTSAGYWIYDARSTGAAVSINLYLETGSGYNLKVYTNNALLISATSLSISAGIWYHTALVRNSGITTLYVNGTSIASVSDSNSYVQGGNFLVGVGWNINNYFPGYISNLRITNGTAVYTTNFTPSTVPLATVTNTVLLTNQYSNSVGDASTVSNVITATGVAVPSLRSPFARVDTSTAATVYGGSVYFGANGSYLSFGTSSQFAFGTGNFTAEAWIYNSGTTAGYGLIVGATVYGSSTNFQLYLNGTTNSLSYLGPASTTVSTAASSITPNAWYHVALVRNGTTVIIYINGVFSASVTDSGSIPSTTALTIGNASNNNANAQFIGYISNVRIVNGQALYTATFTPSVVPLTTSSQGATGTVLLIPGINAGIYDSTMNVNLITTGTAQISTAQAQFGTSSMYFGGSGYLQYSQPSLLTSFTIEFWVYPTVAGNNVNFYTGSANGPVIGYNGTTFSAGHIGSWVVAGALNPTLNAWNHVALVRTGTGFNQFLLYLNGGLVGQGTEPTVFNTQTVYIASSGTAYYYTGYIDELRITNGAARYTTGSPGIPTQAFYDTGATQGTTYINSFTTSTRVITQTTGSAGIGILALGGAVTSTPSGLFPGVSIVHTYTTSGLFTVTNTASSIVVAYLAVGGGGGGGGARYNCSNFATGAGGGGAFMTGTFVASAGQTYGIIVGQGGGAGAGIGGHGGIGTTSIISGPGNFRIQAVGGGAGTPGDVYHRSPCATNGLPGGINTGKASQAGSEHQGGGGAFSSGTYQSAPGVGGIGGAGTYSNISGTLTAYAGGGGGGGSPLGGAGGLGGGGAGARGTNPTAAPGTPGTPGTGGGGGGGQNNGNVCTGGLGGPGIVILSYSSVYSATNIVLTGTSETFYYINGGWTLRPFNTASVTTIDISQGAFDNQANTSTAAFGLSVGTTAQRVTPLQSGAMRFNTTLNTVEVYSTITGTWTNMAPPSYTIEYLAVAAGGGASATAGGGGGAVQAGFVSVSTGNSYTVTVGRGGSGAGGISYIYNNANLLPNILVTGQQALGGNRLYTTSTGLFSGTSVVHIFTATGISYFTATSAIATVAYLVVGGGGGAGGGKCNCIASGGSGGGGGGGFITGTFAALVGTTYTITVGSGGAGASGSFAVGNSGTNSTISGPNISTVRAAGGYGSTPGTGGTLFGAPGGNTGAGSNAGGQWQGGGGAGGAGSQASGPCHFNGSAPVILGPGGVGLQSSITGASTYYAGGGGAAGWYWGNSQLPSPGGLGGGGPGATTSTAGTSGTAGTGGGGGAALNGSPGAQATGGTGGPGIVILSYVNTSTISAITYAYGGSTGTTQGGASGGGVVGQGFTATSTTGAGAYSSTGTGIYSQVTGTQVTYGAGGAATGGSPGGTNTGNGGSAPGGTGGPGIVYVRYLGSQRGSGGTVSTVGTYTLHTFTSTGVYIA